MPKKDLDVTPFRLRVQDSDGRNTTYLVRDGRGHVRYVSGDETPLALSNLVQSQAAELRFALQDCRNERGAKDAVLASWHKAFPNADRNRHPKVEVL